MFLCLPFSVSEEEMPHTNKPAPEPVSKPPVALPVTGNCTEATRPLHTLSAL